MGASALLEANISATADGHAAFHRILSRSITGTGCGNSKDIMNIYGNIDQVALKEYLDRMERTVSSWPSAVLAKAKRNQDINEWNAKVDAEKAAKRRSRKGYAK